MDYETQKEINRLTARIGQLEMELDAQQKHTRALNARFNERLADIESLIENGALKNSGGKKKKSERGEIAEWQDSEYAPGKISAPVFEHITAGNFVAPKKKRGKMQQFTPLSLGDMPRPDDEVVPLISVQKRAPKKKGLQPFVAAAQPANITQNPPTAAMTQQLAVPRDKSFMEQFNDVGASEGFGGMEFAMKFNLRAFSCANIGVRINRPEATPIFTDAPTAERGDFWAKPLKGEQYAVMPNPMLMYDENRHRAGGLVDAFSSNYRGGSFSRVQLVRPAIFAAEGYVWKIVSRGEIKLN